MNLVVSPAVERAALAAARIASESGAQPTRLVDWLRALLADDEGRPFELLLRLGVDATNLRNRLERVSPIPAPSEHELFVSARRHGIRLRGDPDLTTDLLFFAVMVANEVVRRELATIGANAESIERGLVGANMDVPNLELVASTDYAPRESETTFETARILDANLNRARESLRVLDDYVRFAWNDRILTDELKSLRHRLGEATDLLPARLLLIARDTVGDVGTAITAAGEYTRETPDQVAKVNFKRLQESLRSLEEFGKLIEPRFSREIEQIRYSAYTLERTTLFGGDARSRLADARVYVLLTGAQCVGTLDWTIAEAAAGGATVFQLREKELSDGELIDRARQVRRWTREANALFIMNDRPDIAKLSEADGVHLGQDDLAIRDARRILGTDALIGVSTHDIEQVRRAVLDGADYLGVGPTFTSTTKAFDKLAGLDFVREAFAVTSLPAFALGGIAPATIGAAVKAGATRVAVGACVATADEPRNVVRQLMEAFNRSG
jgi:thiamine-phosphate pyrophosphorylase